MPSEELVSWEHFVIARADRVKMTHSMACSESIDKQHGTHIHAMFLLSNFGIKY